MNRAQRLVFLAFCLSAATIVFLSYGPLSSPTRPATVEDQLKKLKYRSSQPTEMQEFLDPVPLSGTPLPANQWNPLRSAPHQPRAGQGPLVGLVAPLALVGLGLFFALAQDKR